VAIAKVATSTTAATPALRRVFKLMRRLLRPGFIDMVNRAA
jgi:hypothetical protein